MSDEEEVWQGLVQSKAQYLQASRGFFREGTDRVGMVRRGLHGGGIEVLTALGMVPYLKVSERLQLFDELVRLSFSQRHGSYIRQIVSTLPREWVLEHIER